MNEGSYFYFNDSFDSLCTVEWNAPGLTVVLDEIGLVQGPPGPPGTPGGPAGPVGPQGPPGMTSPLVQDLTIAAASQTVDATGNTSITLNISVAAPLTLTLAHVSAGIQIFLRVASTATSSIIFQLVMTDTAGDIKSVQGKQAGSAEIDLANTGLTINSGSAYFSGMSGETVAAFQIV